VYKGKKILGLITARGGSKGLPGKNILPLLGKPIIAWTIEPAKKSRYLDDLVLTTDDKKIASIGEKYGAEVPFLRPGCLAMDKTTSMDVILHALTWLKDKGREYDYLVLLEPTSPLREAEDIDKSIKMLIDNEKGAVALVGVSRVEAAHPSFDVLIDKNGMLRPYEKGTLRFRRRQDITKIYFLEGTVYISETGELYRRRSFYHDRTLPYIVPKWKSPELDDIVDFFHIEATLKNMAIIKRKKQ